MRRSTYDHVNLLMQELTDVSYHPSDQNKESGISRQQRDCKDTQIVFDFVEQLSSFEGDPLSLQSLAVGMTAAENVKADRAVEVRKKIIDGMIVKLLKKHSSKHKDQAVLMTMGKTSTAYTLHYYFIFL